LAEENLALEPLALQLDAAQAAIEYQAQQTHKLANMRRLRELHLQEKLLIGEFNCAGSGRSSRSSIAALLIAHRISLS
jgi:hypothetical protein